MATPRTNRVGAYLRVSSKAQDHATQRTTILKAAAARGDRVAHWYAEKVSGKLLARPELDRVRADVRDGRLSRLYVFKLDRLTRSGVGDTYRVVDEFRRAGCELVLVADNLTIHPHKDDVVSDAFVFALSLAAKLERQAINERISAARLRLEAEGRPWGRPARIDSALGRRMKRLQADGRSIREIAVALKVPRSTVGRALKGASPSQKPASPPTPSRPRPATSQRGPSQA
jgi:DNA invertase Pin-like site-specific DNA recombinase